MQEEIKFNEPKFQLNTSRLFLTYPECPVTKEFAVDFFTALLNPSEYVIARERHANGNYHLHCYFKLHNAYRTKDSRALDLILDGDRYHGNYQGCRSAKAVLKYVTKEEDYLSNIDVAAMLATKSNRAAIAKKLITEQKPLEQLVEEYPELIFGYARLKQDINIYKEDLEDKEDRKLPRNLPNPWGLDIISDISGKKRHYWIFSREPNQGKTYHFAQPLQRAHRGYIASGSLDYWNVTKHTNLIILDDYNTAKLKWDALNQLCDGTYQCRVAYRGVVNVAALIIVLSNQTPEDLYPHTFKFLKERFIVMCVDKVHNIDYSSMPYGKLLEIQE